MALPIEQLPPHNIDCEESVNGSILIDNDCLRLVKYLKPSDFFSEQNRVIFEAVLNLADRNTAIDQLTLAEELDRQHNLQVAGGAGYLNHLISSTPTSFDVEYYAQIVHNLSLYRSLINAAGQIEKIGYEAQPDVEGAVKKANEIVSGVRAHLQGRNMELITPEQVALTMTDMLQKPEAPLSWGFRDLDEITGGIFKGDYIVFGARPSMGKSEVMFQVSEKIAVQRHKVLFASVEMGINPVLERYVSRQMGISVKDFRRRQITLEFEDRFMQEVGRISELPIYYLTGNRTSYSIWENARKMKDRYGLDIIFVDYLQLLTDCEDGKDNAAVRVGRVSKNLKHMANELGVPVIVASQLNRGLEAREQKRPVLSDLRESGEIEQDADVVFLLYRDELYHIDTKEPGLLELGMAKNRQLGASPHPVKLAWLKDKFRYDDIYRG